jgi:hypothetical protein
MLFVTDKSQSRHDYVKLCYMEVSVDSSLLGTPSATSLIKTRVSQKMIIYGLAIHSILFPIYYFLKKIRAKVIRDIGGGETFRL